MQTSLAIYDALRQANVPETAARNVAETLEREMSSTFATKQDVEQVGRDLRRDIAVLTRIVDERFTSVEARFASVDARFVAMDTRFVAMDARFVAMDTRFTALDQRFTDLESRFDLKLQTLESRLLTRLGGLIVASVAFLAGLQALLR